MQSTKSRYQRACKPRLYAVRNLISDEQLGLGHTIYFDVVSYDAFGVDYSKERGEVPYPPIKVDGVWVSRTEEIKMEPDRVLVIYEGEEMEHPIKRILIKDLPSSSDDDTFYRCGYCGRLVMSKGELYPYDQEIAIQKMYQARGDDRWTIKVSGACCTEYH